MSAAAPGFSRTRIGLAAAAFLAPFAATHIAGPLTLGRAAALFFAVLLAADLLRRRPLRFQPDPATILLVVGYLGLCAWVFLSAATRGCNCEGKAGGFFEFMVIGLLALVAISFEPRLRGVALIASLAGVTLAAALALGGVGALNSGTIDLTDTGGRLSGTYGNANELGLAAALGIPVALAYISTAGRAARLALAGSTAILAVALVLTYSRGGIIAAGVGVVALALWSARGSRRRVATILVGTALAAVLAAGLYSVFKDRRENASFAAAPVALRALDQRDFSGWDSRALGPIPNGPSELGDGNPGIAVRGGDPGEGASFGWGEAEPGGVYRLRFLARAAGAGERLTYALADRVAGGGRAATARLGREWRPLSLVWRPRIDAPHAGLFLWGLGRKPAFIVSDVRVIAHDAEGALLIVPAPNRLSGSVYAHLNASASKLEERYVQSRLDAAHMAARAFGSSPLLGIGWGIFPSYSAKHADYGRLAAHDEYLLTAAELGLIGLLFLGLMVAAPIVGARRTRPGRSTAAAVGLLSATAAGMVFVEALATPQVSIPIGLAAAILCAGRGESSARKDQANAA